MSRKQYSFPILKLTEIMTCLKELQISVSMEELKGPNAANMRNVFENFIFIMLGISKEDLCQPEFSAMHVFQFPELHEKSLMELSYYNNLLDLMRNAGVHDCSIRQVLHPTAKFIRKVLSALINFAKFREERLFMYNEFQEKTDEIVDLRQKLEEDNATLSAEVEKLRVQREAEEPKIKGLQEELSTMHAQINEHQKTSAGLKKHHKALKAESSEYNDKVATDKFHLLNVQQEVEKLRTQVVRSPERIRRALADMTNEVADKKNEVSDLTSKLRSLQTKSQVFDKLNNKIVKRTLTMNECLDEVNRSKTLFKEIKKNASEIATNEEIIREAVASEQHLKSQIETAQDKLFRLQGLFEKKRQAASLALAQVQKDKSGMEKSMSIERKQVEENLSVVEQLQTELAEEELRHSQDMDVLRKKFQEFSDDINNYHGTLSKAMRV